MSDRFPTLQEAINTAVELGLRNLSTMIPAKVVKYDSATQKANCQILVKQVTESEDGEREVASWPVVPGVPVHCMGDGDFRITFPVDNGTIGMLLFSHRSLDKWLSGSGSEVDPELDHDHALTDAVFVPGLRPFGAPWKSCPTDSASIGDDADGNGRIHFKSGRVNLGDGAVNGVARNGDAINLGQCYVTMSAGSVVAVFINGVQLPTGSDPTAPNRGTIVEGSDHVFCID